MVVLVGAARPLIAPYPNHATIGGFGVILGVEQKSGTVLVGQVPPDQGSVAPTEFGEQAKNPVFGGVVALRDLSRGYGQRRLKGDGNGRYWYMLNARGRPGYAVKGPGLTQITPATIDATVGVTRWFEIGGRILALNGRYALDGGTTGTVFGVSKDFGVGKAATDVVVLKDNHASATTYALVGMGDSENVWTYTGASGTTVWAQTAGADAWKARAFAIDPTTLFYANDANVLHEVDLDANVLTVANHASSTDTIGTKDQPITRLTVNAAGSLLPLKSDDVYSLNGDGSVNRLFEAQQFVSATTNGEALARWGNDTYVTYGNATWRLGADGGLTQVGPELLRDNGSEVRGYVTAMVGTDFFLLAGLYNPDTGASYLMEFTGEVVAGTDGRGEPVWHGSIIAAQAGKRITSLHTSTVGAPTGHKMAYIGFSDGTIAKYVLACTPDPADCDQEVFSTADGQVFHSRMQMHFPGQLKAMIAATGEADNFSSTTYAQLAYRTSAAGSYVNIGTDYTSGDRQRVPFPDSLACTALDTRVTLVSTTAAASPLVTGFSFDWMLRTVPQEVLTVNVLAEDGLRQRDGTPYRYGASEIRDRLAQLAAMPGAIEFVDPNGDTHLVMMLAPSRTIAYDLPWRRPHDAVKVLLIERRPNEQFGALFRLSGLTLHEMHAYTLLQLTLR